MTLEDMVNQWIIPGTLLLTLLGALATFLANERNSRLVALLFSAPAVLTSSFMLWKVGIGAGTFGDAAGYAFHTDWAWIDAIGSRLEFGVDGLSRSEEHTS